MKLQNHMDDFLAGQRKMKHGEKTGGLGRNSEGILGNVR